MPKLNSPYAILEIEGSGYMFKVLSAKGTTVYFEGSYKTYNQALSEAIIAYQRAPALTKVVIYFGATGEVLQELGRTYG